MPGMRKAALAALAGLVAAIGLTAASATASAQGIKAEASRANTPAQARQQRRAATRLRIERQNLPPNAVRTCDAWYEQEFRVSGTVIVPRMRCRWVHG